MKDFLNILTNKNSGVIKRIYLVLKYKVLQKSSWSDNEALHHKKYLMFVNYYSFEKMKVGQNGLGQELFNIPSYILHENMNKYWLQNWKKAQKYGH